MNCSVRELERPAACEIEKTRAETLPELVKLQGELMARLECIDDQLSEIRDDIRRLQPKGEPSPGDQD
jgi:hypothetical protein